MGVNYIISSHTGRMKPKRAANAVSRRATSRSVEEYKIRELVIFGHPTLHLTLLCTNIPSSAIKHVLVMLAADALRTPPVAARARWGAGYHPAACGCTEKGEGGG